MGEKNNSRKRRSSPAYGSSSRKKEKGFKGNCSSDIEFDDGYDDDLIKDEEDRSYLNSLAEIEREKELLKRLERREALKIRFDIEKRLKSERKRVVKESPDKSDSKRDAGEVSDGIRNSRESPDKKQNSRDSPGKSDRIRNSRDSPDKSDRIRNLRDSPDKTDKIRNSRDSPDKSDRIRNSTDILEKSDRIRNSIELHDKSDKNRNSTELQDKSDKKKYSSELPEKSSKRRDGKTNNAKDALDTLKSRREHSTKKRDDKYIKRSSDYSSLAQDSKRLSRDFHSDRIVPSEQLSDDSKFPSEEILNKIYTYDSDEEFGSNSKPSLSDLNSLEDLLKIRVSRFKLGQWVHMPFFNERIVGFFVRLSIGDIKTGQYYRLYEIIGVTTDEKVDNFENTRTNKYLKLRNGKDEKISSMSFVSNQPFSEQEFKDWLDNMKKCECRLPSKADIQRKEDDMSFCKNYTLSERDINLVVKEKNKHRTEPVNLAIAKVSLRQQLDKAKSMKDTAKVAELEEKIESLDKKLNKTDSRDEEKFQRLRDLSEKNKKKYEDEIRKVMIKEYEENKSKVQDSPFVRRQTNPVNLGDAFSRLHNQKNTSTETDIVNITNKQEEKTDSKIKHLNIEDEMRELYNFELDIVIDLDDKKV